MPSIHYACLCILLVLISITWFNESPNKMVRSQSSPQIKSTDRNVKHAIQSTTTSLRVKRNDKLISLNSSADKEGEQNSTTESTISKTNSNSNQKTAIIGQKKKKLIRNKQDYRKKLAASRSKTTKFLRTNNGQCEYIKGPWQDCQRNGIQQRVLKLAKSSSLVVNNNNNSKLQVMSDEQHDSTNNNMTAITNNSTSQNQNVRCDPIRVIRRECNTGCKYLRGEWSAKCVDGQRIRVDTLIGPRWRRPQTTNQNNSISTSTNNGQQVPLITCQAQRKVVKDCKRTCHYIKSDWTDCVNGFKKRTLTLDERPLENLSSNSNVEQNNKLSVINSGIANKFDYKTSSKTGIGCIKTKTIRRVCSVKNRQQKANYPHETIINQQLQQNITMPKTVNNPASID